MKTFLYGIVLFALLAVAFADPKPEDAADAAADAGSSALDSANSALDSAKNAANDALNKANELLGKNPAAAVQVSLATLVMSAVLAAWRSL